MERTYATAQQSAGTSRESWLSPLPPPPPPPPTHTHTHTHTLTHTHALTHTHKTHREVYTDARGLCETLWGQSFTYSNQSETDPDRQCLTMTWNLNQTNPNEVALRNIFGDLVDTVQPAGCGTCGVRVWSALVTLVTVWALAVLL